MQVVIAINPCSVYSSAVGSLLVGYAYMSCVVIISFPDREAAKWWRCMDYMESYLEATLSTIIITQGNTWGMVGLKNEIDRMG